MSNFALLAGGLMSSFGLGWCLGRMVKAVRQFFDSIT